MMHITLRHFTRLSPPRRKITLGSMLVALMIPQLLFAQPCPPATHTASSKRRAINEAQKATLEGQRLISKKRFTQAIKSFEKAHCRVPEVQNLVIIGALYIKLKNCTRAYRTWIQALRECRTCSQRQKITRNIDKYTQACTRYIEIETPNISAKVMIDGYEFGRTPYRGRALLGASIKLKAHQYKDHHEILGLDTPRRLIRTLDRINHSAPSQPFNQFKKPVTQYSPIPKDQLHVPTSHWSGGLSDPPSKSQQSSYLKQGLLITSLVLAATAGGLYGISIHEYNKFKTIKDTRESLRVPQAPSTSLGREVDRAEMMHISSGVLFGLALTTFASTFFFNSAPEYSINAQ